MSLELKYYGDPVLRQKALEIKEVTPEIQELARQMIALMYQAKGCGLAANQVGKLLRVFVSNVDYEDDEGNVYYGEPQVYINPVLSNPSVITVERNEGCLSIPKLFLPVPRPLTVDVEALDINGQPFKKTCTRFLARNIMHENDHLNGVLYIDRVKGKKRNEIEPHLRQIKQMYTKRK